MKKFDIEATVVPTINKVTPDSLITGRNFRFNPCLWGQIQNTGHNGENEQVRLLSRMCAALANITYSKVGTVRLVIYAKDTDRNMSNGKSLHSLYFQCKTWWSTYIDPNPHVLACEITNRIFGFKVTTSQGVTICVNTSTTLSIARQVIFRTSLVPIFK